MIEPARWRTATGSADPAPVAPRWWLIRSAGLAGSTLLAISGLLGGALRTVPFHPTPVSIWRGPHGPATLLCWLAGTALLVWAWWRARHGTPGLRWCLVTVGLWLLPLLVAPPLGSRDVYAYACQGAVYQAGHNPYHEGVAALPCPWVESVAPIWRDTAAPYGPLFLMIAGLAVAVGGTLAGTIAVLRLVAVLGIGLAALGLPVLARRAGIEPARAGWLALACPLVGVHLVSGAHNDALMIGLLIAGLVLVVLATPPAGAGPVPGPADPPHDPGSALGLAGPTGGHESTLGAAESTGAGGPALSVAGWPDGRPDGSVATPGGSQRVLLLVAAGVLLGLAMAVKVTAVAAVPFAALLAVRGPYTANRVARGGGWVLCGALAGLLVVTGASGLGFGWINGLSGSGASVQWTAPSTAVGLTVNLFTDFDAVPVTRAIGLAALAIVLVVAWWRSRTRDALYGAGLALAFTVALAPVFHPWYATWPLFVLAASTRRSGWFAVPCLLACFLALPDGTNLALSTRAQGAVAMTALVGYLLVTAIRRARRPALRS